MKKFFQDAKPTINKSASVSTRTSEKRINASVIERAKKIIKEAHKIRDESERLNANIYSHRF